MSAYSIPPLVTALLFLCFSVYVVFQRQKGLSSLPYIFWCLTTIYWQLSWAALLSVHDPLVAEKIARIGYTGIIFIPIAFYHFTLRFLKLEGEDRRLLSDYFVGMLFVIVLWVGHGFVRGVYRYSWGFYPKAGALHAIYLIFLTYLAAHFMRLLHREKERLDMEDHRRTQVTYVFWALACFICAAVDFLMNYGLRIYPFGFIFTLISLGLVSYAMVKHQLLDIRVVVKRTLLYSIVSALLVSIYVSVVTLIARILEGHVGAPSAYSAAIAAGVITLLFDPLRNRIQRFIDQRFARLRIDREQKLMQFSNQIIERQDVAQTTRSLCQVLSESLHPKSFAIYTRSERDASFMEIYREGPIPFPVSLPPGVAHTEEFTRLGVLEMVPLMSRGEALGYMLIGEKRSELPYTEEDRILLRLLANQAALAYERPRFIHEVSSGLVHEIKMPMANITLPAELTYMQIEETLRERGSTEELLPKIQKRMKYIMDQAMLASQRVDALQEMNDSSFEGFQKISLDQVIQGGLAAVEKLITAHHIEVEAAALPSFAIQGNMEQLNIVFVNLFKNAIEAMAGNDGKPRKLTVQAHMESEQIVIDIGDTGPGVPKADQELIFQSNYTTKGKNGAGMGLFLCRQIVQAHRGKISVSSTAGKTIFSLQFHVL